MKKIIFLLLFICTSVFAEQTYEVFGEAQIMHNDVSTAKVQAQMRARWAAMEEAAQVKVNSSSVIHNAELLDESIKNEVTGSITSFKIIDEGRDGDIYWLQARVTVKPENAQNVMKHLAGNTVIAVITPMVKPDSSIELSHPFSEQLIAALIDEGFDVVDLNLEYPDLSKQIYEAVQQGDMSKVNTLAYKIMAGSVLVGNLKVLNKGRDTGYAEIKFDIVDGNFDYKIIGSKDNKKTIIYSGSVSGRGQGGNINTASMNLSQSLGKKESSSIASTVASKIKGVNKNSVRVVLSGNNDLRVLQELKNDVSNISWVLSVRESGTDTLIVEYGEKPYYLAAVINKVTGYPVKKFSGSEIILGR